MFSDMIYEEDQTIEAIVKMMSIMDSRNKVFEIY